MERIYRLFCELVQMSVGTRIGFSEPPKTSEWSLLLELAKRQAIAATLLRGIEKLPDSHRPPQAILMQWCAIAIVIEDNNVKLNKAATDFSELCEANGFISCILKGQGVALYYPEPLSRHCGDIDIWLGCDERRIIRFVRRLDASAKASYHHIHAPNFEDVEVEVHYRPTFFRSPLFNLRFQRWAKKQFGRQCCNRVIFPGQSHCVSVPTTEFNLVYILLHIYTHFFHEGIGLRQMMDYYYILSSNVSNAQKKEAAKVLQSLGTKRFASSLMYVLHEVFGLDETRYIVPADVRNGRRLLSEILKSGNFGQFDSRNVKKRGRSLLYVGWTGIARNWHFFEMSPSEVLWAPFFKVWHWFWRYFHNILSSVNDRIKNPLDVEDCEELS